ncbi:beta-lactamase family protein [Streptomyces sp. NBC_00237]|uniref:serine hydrolase domain-containing protein n=1 Tax=Streptomyces sp. NBC_00237 TaxID=2975687 RepID=UPI00224D1D95|nr:serine hydrolase domain-containing protein [Streptomyces sp. NBC_00237]MCX5202787.1 beta-lactamase family protein [Streptomyces sp. NBC_00237]
MTKTDSGVPWAADRESGDFELALKVRRALGAPGNFHTVSVALLASGETRFASLGTGRTDAGGPATPDTSFETGSVAKVFTGMLLAALDGAGTVSADQSVASALPDARFAHAGAASATLAELASHRSGLPRLHHRAGLLTNLRLALAVARGRDPYRAMGVAEFLRHAVAVAPTQARGTFAYSNLGMSLLGHTLGAHVEGGYPALLERELLAPLGMSATEVRTTYEPVKPIASFAGPHAHTGKALTPWISAGYAPAGVGMRSTARDLSLLIRAMLEGNAPGADAARPRYAADGDRVGFGWITSARDGRAFTWHNGATDGSRSFVGFDRERGRGVVLLSNTDQDVDAVGARLVLDDD